MWAHLAAVIALAIMSAPPPERHLDQRVAINPNISLDDCLGGRPIALAADMQARQYHGSFAGELDGYELFGYGCSGYFEPEAQFCVAVPGGGGWYTFEIVDGSGVDTTLAIVDQVLGVPQCDDDSGSGLLSRISNYFEPGEYLVYVGAYSEGGRGSFSLQVSGAAR